MYSQRIEGSWCINAIEWEEHLASLVPTRVCCIVAAKSACLISTTDGDVGSPHLPSIDSGAICPGLYLSVSAESNDLVNSPY